LQQRKRARHIRFESVDLDVSDAEDEAVAAEPMVIDLLSQADEEEDYDYDYDYAESVVDDNGEVDDDNWNAMDTSNSVMMPQTSMVQMARIRPTPQSETYAIS
jgi:hypothetical protein